MAIVNKYNKCQCPCCSYYTFEDDPFNTMGICDVCFWQSDGLQLRDPEMEHGANVVSLNQARINFQKFGASEERFLVLVRPPHEDEK